MRISIFFSTLVLAVMVGLPLAAWAGPVNINTADAATLATELQGVGDARARAIIQYREANGPFSTPADLMSVKGIGPRIYEVNQSDILVETQGAALADDG